MVRLVLLCFCIVILWAVSSYAAPNYQVIVKNEALLDNNTLEFDVFIKSDSTLILTSYQCVLNFLCNNLYGDVFRFKYVNGSSQLKNIPNILMDLNFIQEYSEIRFASGANVDTINSTQKRIGSFILTRDGVFDKNTILLSWNFQGNNPTILTNANFDDITDPSDFVSVPMNNQVEQVKEIPSNFSLSQNYPNPFNPTTTIEYQIPKRAEVSLKVYNILGEVVATLVDGVEDSGIKKVVFNGINLASGVYIYVLRAGGLFFDKKKMLLLK
jgi:Secretion system C-terminal sorting domain